MTEKQMFMCLKSRYPVDEYALLDQVRNATGYARQVRTADALALSLWPSRGLHLHGFEFKASRGDFLNEIKHPAKAEEIAQYCEFWWIVVPDGLVKKEEVPEGWGLMYALDSRKEDDSRYSVKVIKHAVKKEAVARPIEFWAAILRRAQATCTRDAVEHTVKHEEFERGRALGIVEGKRRAETLQGDYDRLRKCVDEFRKNSGVDIGNWRSGDISVAVKAILDGTDAAGKVKVDMSHLLKDAQNIVKYITEHIEGKHA